MNFVAALIPAVVVFLGITPWLGVLFYWRERERRYARTSPLTRNLMRSPGYSLRMRIVDLDDQLTLNLVVVFLAPITLFSIHVSQSYFANEPESAFRFAVMFALYILVTSIAGYRLFKILRDRKLAVLGLEGEIATGEELNQLMLDGCRVFHDIPFPYGNIDHVVVSKSGVYSVNSKVRGKPRFCTGKAEVTVDHEQGTIRFPDRECRIPVKQLETETNWLAQQLTSSVGSPVKVEAIIALPGWFVKERIGRGPVFVLNPHKPKNFFIQNREVFTPELIQQIAHQIEQLCRDVAPSFQNKPKRWEDKT